MLVATALFACEKCKSCYLMESNGTKTTETYIGDRCDQEIDDLESHSLVCVDSCYYECR